MYPPLTLVYVCFTLYNQNFIYKPESTYKNLGNMKINRLETHDRLEHFIEDQSNTVWQGADDCLKKNPYSLKLQEKSPYIYIFAHPRTADDGINKRMLWQPRLTKPVPQTNSYLFRAISHTDTIEICWLLPPKEMWSQYEEGKVCESNWALWSIDQFKNNRKELEKPFPDDWSDSQARNIIIDVLRESTRETLVASEALQRAGSLVLDHYGSYLA